MAFATGSQVTLSSAHYAALYGRTVRVLDRREAPGALGATAVVYDLATRRGVVTWGATFLAGISQGGQA